MLNLKYLLTLVLLSLVLASLPHVLSADSEVFEYKKISVSELRKNSADTSWYYKIVEKQLDLTDEALEAKIEKYKNREVHGERLIVKYKGEKYSVLIPIKKGSLDKALAAYKKKSNVEYAEPDFIVKALYIPNDLHYPLQWNLRAGVPGSVNAEKAWNKSIGTRAVVAVLDTGVAYRTKGEYEQAPDLQNTCFVPGYDFVNKTDTPYDNNGHGTHVAGTIAGSTNNVIGVAGIAFNSCIMPVKILNKNGLGTYSRLAVAVRWAADHGADVINLSLGGPVPSREIESALQYAYEKGVVIIAAAGNDGINGVNYPAAYDDYVIAVGASVLDGSRAWYSNIGDSLDLLAPGGDVSSDADNNGFGDGILQNTFNPYTKNYKDFAYWFMEGTSMAAAHASGVAALLIAKGTAATPDEVRSVLTGTAKDLGAPGYDIFYGYGLVDAASAMGVVAP